MLPTLIGRIQSRVVLLLVFGGLVTTLIAPLLPVDASIGLKYANAYLVLVTVTVLGVLWEFVYHFIMQFRWEKDWPTLFGLVTLVPEGLLVWGLGKAGAIPFYTGSFSSLAFWIHFVIVWLVVWIIANGPLRVPLIRWRFRGGRFV
jgi:hypothetical protein